MGFVALFFIAVGLSMDAFAVAVGHGLCMKSIDWRKALVIGLYFGVFQAVMPLIGYFLGYQFADIITAYDHWIAFGLLVIIGGKMIKESFDHSDEECDVDGASIHWRTMLPLAVATSIDALAVGVSFAFLQVDILPAVLFIGVITFVLSIVGVKVGQVFGSKYKSKAEFAGGVILILMGLKILLEHLGVLPF